MPPSTQTQCSTESGKKSRTFEIFSHDGCPVLFNFYFWKHGSIFAIRLKREVIWKWQPTSEYRRCLSKCIRTNIARTCLLSSPGAAGRFKDNCRGVFGGKLNVRTSFTIFLTWKKGNYVKIWALPTSQDVPAFISWQSCTRSREDHANRSARGWSPHDDLRATKRMIPAATVNVSESAATRPL